MEKGTRTKVDKGYCVRLIIVLFHYVGESHSREGVAFFCPLSCNCRVVVLVYDDEGIHFALMQNESKNQENSMLQRDGQRMAC